MKNLDELRNTQLNIAQSELDRKEQLLNINYEITKMEKKYSRYKKLMSEDLAISQEAFEILEDELMPRLQDGRVVDCVYSFVGLHTRMNNLIVSRKYSHSLPV